MLNVWPEDIPGLVAAYSAVLGCILLTGLALDARALLLAWARQRRARRSGSGSQEAELMAGAASEGEEAPPGGGRHSGGGAA